MSNFDSAYNRTLGFEGKILEDVSGDPGGETFYGISRVNHPNWSGWVLIDEHKKNGTPIGKDLSLPPLVKQFYKTVFWDAMKLSEVNSQAIAEEIFDTAVNCSTHASALMVQRSLNVLNKGGLFWPDLKADGNMGSTTASTVNKCTEHDPDYERQLLKLLNALQAAYYCAIAEKNPALEKFMYGWLKQRVQS
jgi:lysozyme family protein